MPVVTFLGEIRKAGGRPSVEIEAETVVRLLAAMGSAVGPDFAGLLSTGHWKLVIGHRSGEFTRPFANYPG